MPKASRPVPQPTPETQHFWNGTKQSELRLQRCDACKHVYFPPRPFCPQCSCRDVTVFRAAGRGRLLSYVINERGHPAWDGPYSIAIVELDEGVRMMSNIIDCEQTPDALALDMPLEVTYLPLTDDITLPLFRPVGAPS